MPAHREAIVDIHDRRLMDPCRLGDAFHELVQAR
jgi:hypothetical protein